MKSLKNPFKSMRLVKKLEASKTPKIEQPKYQGKGTMARLKTAAEKMFNSKYST